MGDGGLKQARELTTNGLYYDNLVQMAQHCKEENHPDKLMGAYVLNRIFMQLADELGDGPVMSSEMRRLEAKYRTSLNLALEKTMEGAPYEEQNKRFIELIQLLWTHSEV